MLQSCGEGKERIHYWHSRGYNSGAKNFADFRTMRFNSSAHGHRGSFCLQRGAADCNLKGSPVLRTLTRQLLP